MLWALTADGILEVGALRGVIGELDPAEPPESLRPAGRVVPLLRGQGWSGPRNAAAHLPHLRGQSRTFKKKSLRVYARSNHEISSSDSLVPHLPFISAPRDSGMSACSVISCQWGAGLRRVTPRPPPSPAAHPNRSLGPTHIHVVACPHVVRDDELGGEFRHEARRPVLPHHKDILFGVRGEPGEVFNFLLGSQTSHGVCGYRGAERQPPALRPSGRPHDPTALSRRSGRWSGRWR